MVRAGFRKGAKIERWEKALANPAKALKQIGVLMVAESQEAFVNQRLGEDEWPARADINVFGILADFKKGAEAPPNRRFQNRPALQDTGRLLGSIAFSVSGNTVTVGSNVEYAAAHHRGEEVESEEITDEVAERLWTWLKGPGSEYKKELGWLLNKKFRNTRLKTQLPKRPIVGITKQTLDDVREVVGVEIFEVK